jgi:nicotinamide riboside transporter PnuC
VGSADIIGWLVTAVCLAGTVLNVKKVRWCFHLWAVGNIAWLAIDIHNRLYSRALLDLVQLALAIWGAVEWRRGKA